MSDWYDGTKLLSMMDLNGNKPEIYVAEGNRTGGKTTYYNRLMINRFKKDKSKFACLVRFKDEIKDYHEKFFKDIKELFFPYDNMDSERKDNGCYAELYLNGESCGYVIALNSADRIKKISHLFTDVDRILFDEFQSETNHYCTDETKKFISVHTSIARGHGKHVRYVPVYMCSNSVTLLNPYYAMWNIGHRITKDTKYLKGVGLVMERAYIEKAAEAQLQSGFMQACMQDSYVQYSSQNVYLNDNLAFIAKPEGRNRYLGTLIYNGREHGIYSYDELGIIYISNKSDTTAPFKISVTTEDHNINYIMLKSNDMFIQQLRYFFDRGCCRFADLVAKECLMKTISYN